jgi:hypothetical protein
LFVTSQPDPTLPVLSLDLLGEENRGMIWTKTRLAWMHAYTNHLNDFDWFVKADDDTYIEVSNLKQMLARHVIIHLLITLLEAVSSPVCGARLPLFVHITTRQTTPKQHLNNT